MKKLINIFRSGWANLKTKLSSIHITSAVQIVDGVVNLSAKAEVKAEEIKAIVAVLPIPETVKSEVETVITLSIPVLKLLSNKAELKHIYDDVRTGLAAEIANIITGKINDINVIKQDIKSLFTTEVKDATASAQ